MKNIKNLNKKSLGLYGGILVVVGLLAFGGSYAFASAQNSKKFAAKKSSSQCANAVCVSLKKGGADPNELSVTKGSFVQFNSKDGKAHELSIGEGGEDGKEHDHHGSFHSPEIGVDEGWRVQFKEPGNYFFHDHENPEINVLVVVYEPGADHTIK